MSRDPSRSGDPRADRRAETAQRLAREGDAEAAADLMRQAVEIAPGWALGHVRLAELEEEAGRPESAAAILKGVEESDEDGRLGVALRLAALGEAPLPDAAPPAYVEGLFDDYAERFERSLVGALGYRMPDILLADLLALRPHARFKAALDLGCGTGLMGERLRPHAARLDGLDLSAGMLRKARAKGVYDSLTQGDLLDERHEWAGAYDLVAAADVLIYVGDLSPVFASVARRLQTDGIFAFSVERADDDVPFAIRPSLRFSHGARPLREALDAAGFDVLSLRECTVRRDRGADIAGLAVIAALRPRQG
ncbi:methyltransferase [Aureimonas mangrovi]|uniref:methyltransferase n=1 Tax=Aureimonas mangrovi TaxID=2758041 RepID=UPI001FE45C47|nr:methyltransferase domain-containing protein [Aureimonas mangrovi]